jgi:hypothetical protein
MACSQLQSLQACHCRPQVRHHPASIDPQAASSEYRNLHGYDLNYNYAAGGDQEEGSGELTAIASDLPSRCLHTTTLGLAEHEVFKFKVHTARRVYQVFNL